MFQDLLLFEKKRSPKEAIGFYLAYLLLLMLLGGLVAFFLAEGYEDGFKVGLYFGVIFCMGLSTLILQKKNLLDRFGLILVVVASGFSAVFMGGLLGLIPTAYLTTLENKYSE